MIIIIIIIILFKFKFNFDLYLYYLILAQENSRILIKFKLKNCPKIYLAQDGF